MKNEISSFELHHLIKELKVLEGSKIDRIYHSKLNPKELIIGCHISSQGKKFLRIILPGFIFLDESKDASDTPTGFGMMLRKYLEGGRIKDISQKDFERVVDINIEVKLGAEISQYRLIVELFSKGNIIFTDKDQKILNIIEEQSWKDRTLKRGETYKYPASKVNALTILETQFKDNLLNSGKESLVKALAISMNLGGIYAEEVCHMSKLDKNMDIKKISDKQIASLYESIKLLFQKESSPNMQDENAYPIALAHLNKDDAKTFEKFSDAIRENYGTVKSIDSKKGSQKNIEKIQNVIDEQEKTLKECEEGYLENQAKGEIIYEKYQELSEIITSVREARKKYSWNAIKQKLDENPKFKKIIKDIDEKNNSIIIEIEK